MVNSQSIWIEIKNKRERTLNIFLYVYFKISSQFETLQPEFATWKYEVK